MLTTKSQKILIIFIALTVLLGLAEIQPNPLLSYFLDTNPRRDFIVVAHKGTSKYAPENTIAAFRKALALGANGIECDVIFTRDDVPVIAHQSDLSYLVPLEQRPAIISDMTLSEVKELDVGSWFSDEYRGECVPTLEEGLLFLKGRVDRVYLHDKSENDYSGAKQDRVRIFGQTIRLLGMKDHVVVMVESGNLSLWRKLAPDIPLLQCWVGPIYQKDRIKLDDSFRSGIRHMGFYHSDGQLNSLGKLFIRMGFHDLGTFVGFYPNKEVVSWYTMRNCDFTVFTINNAFIMKLYIDAGFRAIGTDDPSLLISILHDNHLNK